MESKHLRLFLFVIIAILLISLVNGEELAPSRQQRLKYGLSLYISDVHTEPAEINPGSEAILLMKLENVASSPLKDVAIKLELPSEFASVGLSEKKIRLLNGLNTTDLNFSIVALPSAKEGIYKVPLRISYVNEIGDEYKENNTISLKISAEPRIFVGLTSSSIYEGNPLGKVDIRIANIGVGKIKFLTVYIMPSENYEIIGSDNNYVGEIDSDDYETVSFKLKAKEGEQNINLALKLNYADANNKEYTRTFDVLVTVASEEEAGIKQNNKGFYILLTIAILISYFVYRRYRKRLRKHK